MEILNQRQKDVKDKLATISVTSEVKEEKPEDPLSDNKTDVSSQKGGALLQKSFQQEAFRNKMEHNRLELQNIGKESLPSILKDVQSSSNPSYQPGSLQLSSVQLNEFQ